LKTHLGVLTLLVISAITLIVGASSSLAAAQLASPCTATLSLADVPAQFSNSNFPLVVPISASCPGYYGTQVYATGSAYDATSSTSLGTANALLSSVNGGPLFNGQLGFNVQPTSPGDSVQIVVSIYDSQGGALLATTGETIPVGTGIQPVQTEPVQIAQPVTTTTVTEGQYPYPSSYPLPNQPSLPYQNSFRQTHYLWQGLAYRSNNANLFDWAVIIAIIASVVIATAGLLIVTRPRHQPIWYAWPPPPSQ